MYNNANIEKLGIFSVWLKHQDKVIRCSFCSTRQCPNIVSIARFQALKLLNIMYNVLDQQQVSRQFDLQTKEASGIPERRTNSTSTSSIGATNNCINIPDYFTSSAKKEADKRESRILFPVSGPAKCVWHFIRHSYYTV